MTKIIAVVGSKGGIGKTTTLKNIAALRASAGKSSIVVDVDDRQHSFDIWYKRREDFGMANYIDYNGNLTLISEDSSILNGVIDSCVKTGADTIFVDLPGRLDTPQAEMLLRADYVLCPLSGSPDDYDVLPQMTERMAKAAKYKPDLVLNVLYNKAHPNAKRRDSEYEDLNYQCSKMGRVCLLPIHIKDLVAVKDSAKYGLALFEYAQLPTTTISDADHNVKAYEELYEIIFDEKWKLSKEFANGKIIADTA